MGKGNVAPAAQLVAVSRKAVNSTLDQLFSTSSGPVKAPSKVRYEALPPARPAPPATTDDEDDEEDSSTGSDDEAEQDVDEEESQEDDVMDVDSLKVTHAQQSVSESRSQRKRRRADDEDDLESKYLARLADEAEEEPSESTKRQKVAVEDRDDDDSSEDEEGSETVQRPSTAFPANVPQHESLTKSKESVELDKSNRTLFLGNVSSAAIADKQAKKILLQHLSSFLKEMKTGGDSAATPKLESIRFRSTAFSGGALPKKASFIKKELMNETTKSTNAYVVYSTTAAAREAVKHLNGTVVLDRHLRVDGVAHPAKVDHRRCVFVGNLGFVDDESLLDKDGDTKKKRNKAPADVEEGLWREFNKVGAVESVRVVRDAKTRVGKGFAYVQFKDANGVEAALLLNDKKFPPMLPRSLRVTRAKAVNKTAARQAAGNGPPAASKGSRVYNPKVTAEQQTMHGRAAKLFGKAGAAELKRRDRKGGNARQLGLAGIAKTPESIIFEGHRASEKAGRPKDLKFSVKSKGGKKKVAGSRSSKRAAEWRKAGGQKTSTA